QPDPFLRPSSSNPIPDSIPEGSSRNHGGQSSSDRSLKKAKPVISHHNAWIKTVSMKKRLARKKSLKTRLMQKESVSKQGRIPAKSGPTVHKDPAFDDLDDAMDYMETEDAHDEGTVKDSEEKRVSTEDKVSTEKLKVSTDKPNEGTAEQKNGNSDKSVAPTTIFRDDETIASRQPARLQNPATNSNRSLPTVKKGKNTQPNTHRERKYQPPASPPTIAAPPERTKTTKPDTCRHDPEAATMAAFTNES
ncbi:hypothetical protein Tco_0942199, partial [Tanacetum coccineum]